MNNDLITLLEKASYEDIKHILDNKDVNLFTNKNVMEVIVDLNDFTKFELFYNDKRSQICIDEIKLLNKSIQNNNTEITSLLLKSKKTIKILNRTHSNLLLSLKEDNPKIIKAFLSSEISISNDSINELTAFLIGKSFVNSLKYIISNDKYKFVFNSSKCWLSFGIADFSLLELYTNQNNFRYLNNQLITNCYLQGDVEKTTLLSSLTESNEEFIAYVIMKKNRRARNNDSTQVFKSLLKVPHFISKFNKNNLKQFKNENDRIMVLKAQQVFKIQNF